MRTALAWLTLLGLLGGLVACGAPGESAAPPAATAQEAAPAATTPTGKLTVGLSSLGSNEIYLPWLDTARESWIVQGAVYEFLVYTAPGSGAVEPGLAERWEMEDGGRRWRFFLRPGIPFHNGQGELTAEDVQYSAEMIMSDQSVTFAKPVLKELIDRVEVAGPYEVVFHLKQPIVTFLGYLTDLQGMLGIVSKQYVEAVGEREAAARPVGSGPFRLVEYKRQQSVTLEAVDAHWRRTPRFRTVVLRRVADPSARLAMLRSGDVDVAEIPFKLKREAEAAGLGFLRSDAAAVYHVHLGGQVLPTRDTFDPSVPWVGDPRDAASQERALKVRQALDLAVDKQAIINGVFEGEGTPSAYPWVVPGSEFVAPGVVPSAYDPERARRLLAEAGYSQGFGREIEMYLVPFPGRGEMVDVGEAVAGYWERNLGLQVRRVPAEWATFAPQKERPRKMAWAAWAYGAIPRPSAEPAITMISWLTSKSPNNTIAETPRLDELYGRIVTEPDRASRVQLYRELGQLIHDQHYVIPIAAVPGLYAVNSKAVGSWPLAPGEPYIHRYEYAVPAR